MTKKPSKQVNPTAYAIALYEARALRTQARNTHMRLSAHEGDSDKSADVGSMLAALVTIGLSLELYLKAFMVVARDGRVVREHDLVKLYAEFPRFLKTALEARYARDIPPAGWATHMIALRTSPIQPMLPDHDGSCRPGYGSFDAAIRSLANSFTGARYFYENIGDHGWATFDYGVEPGLYLADVIDEVIEDWRSGVFTGLASS